VIIRLTGPAASYAASTAAALALAATVTVTAGCGNEGTASSAPPPATMPAQAGSQAFCGTARRFNADQAAIDQVVAQATRGTPAKAAVSAALRAARDAETTSATLRGLAPPSLRPAVRVVTTTWEPFFAAVIRVGGQVIKLPLSAEQDLRAVVTKPAFQAPARAVSAYEARACGLTPPHGH